MKNVFYFTLEALFVFKMFRFLSWLWGHVQKTGWLERQGYFQDLWRHNLVNQQLQYIYCSISHDLKATRLKHVQLIEYNKRNISLQKLCSKWGRDTSSRPRVF